jgi:hypothetical protein
MARQARQRFRRVPWRFASLGPTSEEETVADDFVLQLRVDLKNYPKFPAPTTASTTPRPTSTFRQQLDGDSGAELPDYSGAYKADLRFTDFSKEALASKFLPWSEAYMQLCVDGWAREVAKRYGAETMAEIEWAAWNDQVVPEIERMSEGVPAGRQPLRGSEPQRPRERAGGHACGLQWCVHDRTPSTRELSKPELVTWLLGSHEYLLQCIEAWATQITRPLRPRRDVRHPVDAVGRHRPPG